MTRRPECEGWAADQVRSWTRYLVCGWRDPALPAPPWALPVREVGRLGLGPLAYRVLRDRGDARARAFEAQHRAAAVQNLRTMARVARAREALAARGIVAVLIKGGAFLLRHSPSDLGVRAMADFDLLVGPERFDEAFAILAGTGWRRLSPELRYSSRVAPAITLVTTDASGAAIQLDLHRHLAQWPLLRAYPGTVLARAVEIGGWRVPSLPDAMLITAAHRARHAFAGDGRELLDLAVSASGLDDTGWATLLDEARALGLTGALYGTMRQAAWWFGRETGELVQRARALRARLGRARASLIDRMADPGYALTQCSPWSGPLGRNFGVFPTAFHAPLRSLVAAAVFLPRRVMEGWAPAGRRCNAG